MKRKKEQLGRLETKVLSYVQLTHKNVIRSGELVKPLNLEPVQERKLLSRMAQSGIIVRLTRGAYLIPLRIPAGCVYNPGEYLILQELMKLINGKYQISGFNAFNFYGFSEQIPSRVYVYNNRLSCERNIGGIEFIFMKVDDNRLGATYEFVSPDGIKVIMSSKIRTLLDAVYDWSRYNTIPKAYKWITNCIDEDESLIKEFINIVIKFGNQGTLRRVGYLLSSYKVEENFLEKLKKSIRKSKSLIPWIPTKPAKGTISKEWGIIVNGK